MLSTTSIHQSTILGEKFTSVQDFLNSSLLDNLIPKATWVLGSLGCQQLVPFSHRYSLIKGRKKWRPRRLSPNPEHMRSKETRKERRHRRLERRERKEGIDGKENSRVWPIGIRVNYNLSKIFLEEHSWIDWDEHSNLHNTSIPSCQVPVHQRTFFFLSFTYFRKHSSHTPRFPFGKIVSS